MRTSTSITRRLLSILAGAAVLGLAPAPAQAQNPFPCGGGPNEQQIGVDTNGPVTVPLCIERPRGQQMGEATEKKDRSIYMPPPAPSPPRGWKQVYGAWKGFEVGRIADTARYKYDYVISLGHTTRDEALAAVRDLCAARNPIFAGSCDGFVIEQPFVQVIQYPETARFGNQAGTYFANSSMVPIPQGAGYVERASGKWDYCSGKIQPEGECARVVAFLTNGEIPAANDRRSRPK